jgi:hypothetical protein
MIVPFAPLQDASGKSLASAFEWPRQTSKTQTAQFTTFIELDIGHKSPQEPVQAAAYPAAGRIVFPHYCHVYYKRNQSLCQVVEFRERGWLILWLVGRARVAVPRYKVLGEWLVRRSTFESCPPRLTRPRSFFVWE